MKPDIKVSEFEKKHGINLGTKGEELLVDYLKRHGWKELARLITNT